MINRIRRLLFPSPPTPPPPPSVYTRDLLKKEMWDIGEFTYGKPTILSWGEGSKFVIGKYCSIAENVQIFLGGNHRTDWISTYPFNVLSEPFPEAVSITGHPQTKGDVRIGNDVWIANDVTILSGVTIGDGAVLATGAIISKDVGAYEIWAGNPAKCIKMRFSKDQVKALLSISWWNWPVEKVAKNVHSICSPNIDQFITQHKKEQCLTQ